MNRRHFLQHTLTAAAAPFALGATRALAHQSSDPQAKFVLIRVHGAMDSTLGLHPHTESVAGIAEQDLFLGYDPLTLSTRKIGGTDIDLGPAAGSLIPFVNKMAIARGIYVSPSDLGHPFAIQHMTSGRTEGSAPSWAAYTGKTWATPGSFSVANNAVQRGTLPEFPALITSSIRAQVVNAATSRPSPGLALYQRRDLGVMKFLDFINERDKLDKFMEIYNQVSQDAEANDLDVTFACLYAGFTRVAQIDLEASGKLPNLDTHGNHPADHERNQKMRWDLIAKFLGQLQNSGLLDSTLVVVITEFNRTPGLNANGGKDHNNSDNAVAIFGRGVNGGTVVGNRTLYKREDGFPYAYWAGQFLDFESGESIAVSPDQPAPRGLSLLHPADIWRTIALSLDDRLRSYLPAGSKVVPGLFAAP